jgi:hypothetical protein
MPILRYGNVGLLEQKLCSQIGAYPNIRARFTGKYGKDIRSDKIVKILDITIQGDSDWTLREYIDRCRRLHTLNAHVEFYDTLTRRRLNKNRRLKSFATCRNGISLVHSGLSFRVRPIPKRRPMGEYRVLSDASLCRS